MQYYVYTVFTGHIMWCMVPPLKIIIKIVFWMQFTLQQTTHNNYKIKYQTWTYIIIVHRYSVHIQSSQSRVEGPHRKLIYIQYVFRKIKYTNRNTRVAWQIQLKQQNNNEMNIKTNATTKADCCIHLLFLIGMHSKHHTT